MKKKTTIKRGSVPPTTISNNTFTGVKWDSQAIEAVNSVARGLENLTRLFHSQNY